MTSKVKLLFIGCIILTVQFALSVKAVGFDRSWKGVYTPASEWISVGLVGVAAIFMWLLFLRARREQLRK